MRYLLPTVAPIAANLAGTVAFYGLFLLTGDARLAAGIGLAIGLGQLAWHRGRRRPVPALLLVGVAMTAALGALTLLTADPRFLLLKPSIVYLAVAAAMLRRGWVICYVPALAVELLPRATLDRVGWGWAALMVATAMTNLLLLATLPPARAAALFVIGATAGKLLLFAAQYATLRLRAGRVALSARPAPPAAAPDHKRGAAPR